MQQSLRFGFGEADEAIYGGEAEPFKNSTNVAEHLVLSLFTGGVSVLSARNRHLPFLSTPRAVTVCQRATSALP